MGEIDEDICVKIKPYIKGTNNIDYSHKCSKKNNKCVTIQRECEDYDSNTESSYYCTQINFEGNHNKKCFLDGNHCDINKKVTVWYSFSPTHAHIIVQDEGEGFQDLEKWNEFNKKRLECLHNNDFMELSNYVSFRTKESDSQDGGNALFAALEYWNGGFVYNGKRNAVAMLKKYQQKFHNANHDGE